MSTINKDNEAIRAEDVRCYRVISVSQIYNQSYAVGGSNTAGGNGCVGGAATLWGTENGIWVHISSTQNIGFACSQLDKYKVPAAIAGTKCYDSSSDNGVRVYSRS